MPDKATARVAVVTGSGRGIGEGIARRLVAEGYRVTLNGLSSDPLAQVAQRLTVAGGEVLVVEADVSTSQGAETLLKRTVEHFGAVDVLVNNAAWAVPVQHLLEMTEAHWDRVLQNNLKSVFLCTAAAARWMVANDRPGSIVCISSFGAIRAHRSMAAYDASKGGVEAFTRAAALDLAPFRIRVNAVGPGAIHTAFFDDQGAAGREERARPVPLARVGLPEEVAGAVAYLASDDSAYVTGQAIYVDGGVTAQLRPPTMDRTPPDAVIKRLRQAQDPVQFG